MSDESRRIATEFVRMLCNTILNQQETIQRQCKEIDELRGLLDVKHEKEGEQHDA